MASPINMCANIHAFTYENCGCFNEGRTLRRYHFVHRNMNETISRPNERPAGKQLAAPPAGKTCTIVAMESIAAITLFRCFLLNFSLHWSMYVISMFLKHERFFHVTGAFAVGLLAYLSYEWNGQWSFRQTVQTWMVCIWALRIGLFLFLRILKEGQDRRFDGIRTNPMKFFLAWTLNGCWVFVMLFPTFLLNSRRDHLPLCWRDHVGWGLWCLGFAIETLSDYQKTKFRNSAQNKGRFIRSGLWSVSRHPNYCGDILLWFGLYTAASSVMKGYQLLAILCPLFNYLLITQYSGVPVLEKQGLLKWGMDREYRSYVRSTPVLFPIGFT